MSDPKFKTFKESPTEMLTYNKMDVDFHSFFLLNFKSFPKKKKCEILEPAHKVFGSTRKCISNCVSRQPSTRNDT